VPPLLSLSVTPGRGGRAQSSQLVVFYSPAWREMTTHNLTWLDMAREEAREDDATKVRALSVTHRALSVTQRALSVT
jgi:hypothetical protein